jgi:hypothetical protein
MSSEAYGIQSSKLVEHHLSAMHHFESSMQAEAVEKSVTL